MTSSELTCTCLTRTCRLAQAFGRVILLRALMMAIYALISFSHLLSRFRFRSNGADGSSKLKCVILLSRRQYWPANAPSTVSRAPRFCNEQTAVFKTGSSANEGALATLPKPLQLEGRIDASMDLALDQGNTGPQRLTSPNFTSCYTMFRKVNNFLEHKSGPTTFYVSQNSSLGSLS